MPEYGRVDENLAVVRPLNQARLIRLDEYLISDARSFVRLNVCQKPVVFRPVSRSMNI